MWMCAGEIPLELDPQAQIVLKEQAQQTANAAAQALIAAQAEKEKKAKKEDKKAKKDAPKGPLCLFFEPRYIFFRFR